jgi:hypothetical protein
MRRSERFAYALSANDRRVMWSNSHGIQPANILMNRPTSLAPGDDRARDDAICQVVGADQRTRSAGGVAKDSDTLQPQLVNKLDDVVRPFSQAAPRLVVRQPQSRSIDADQADTGAPRRFGESVPQDVTRDGRGNTTAAGSPYSAKPSRRPSAS